MTNQTSKLPAIFPEAIKLDVVSTLKAFDRISVIRENGKFTTMTGSCITDSDNAEDFMMWEYHKDQFFTAEEKIINYVESFHCFPAEYKGKFDYTKIHLLAGKGTYHNDDALVEMIDGNIVISLKSEKDPEPEVIEISREEAEEMVQYSEMLRVSNVEKLPETSRAIDSIQNELPDSESFKEAYLWLKSHKESSFVIDDMIFCSSENGARQVIEIPERFHDEIEELSLTHPICEAVAHGEHYEDSEPMIEWVFTFSRSIEVDEEVKAIAYKKMQDVDLCAGQQINFKVPRDGVEFTLTLHYLRDYSLIITTDAEHDMSWSPRPFLTKIANPDDNATQVVNGILRDIQCVFA